MMSKIRIENYFLTERGLGDEMLVWGQMFFEDGSITEGKHFPISIYDSRRERQHIARTFLENTHRKNGVLLLWGCGRVMSRKCVINKDDLLIMKKLTT